MHGSDRHARCVGRHEDLGQAVGGPCGHQQVVGLGRRLDRLLRAVEHDLGAIETGFEGDGPEAVVGARLGVAPRRDGRACQQAGEYCGVLVAAGGAERRGHDVGGQQRSWRGATAELEGDQAEVDQTLAADGAAAVILADEQ